MDDNKASFEREIKLELALADAQATIQRLEGERDDARWFNDNYLKAINKMGNKELELRDRLATVEAALNSKEIEVVILQQALKNMLMSADYGWYRNNEGHDWREAVDQARKAIAPALGGQEGVK